MTLTTHFCLVSRLRMCGTILWLPHISLWCLLNKRRYKRDLSQFEVGTVSCEVGRFIKRSSTLVFYWVLLSVSWNI